MAAVRKKHGVYPPWGCVLDGSYLADCWLRLWQGSEGDGIARPKRVAERRGSTVAAEMGRTATRCNPASWIF